MSCESQVNYFATKHKISLRDLYIGRTWCIDFSSEVDQKKSVTRKKYRWHVRWSVTNCAFSVRAKKCLIGILKNML